jgi:hypothetical protein
MRIKVIHTMFRLTPYILLAASAATPSHSPDIPETIPETPDSKASKP